MNRPNKKTSMEDGQVYELTGLLSSLDVTSPSRLHYLIHPLECPFSDAPISCSFVGFSRNAILEHTLETHHIQMDHSHQVTFFLKEYFDMIGMTAEYLHADQINKSVVHVCSLVSAEDDAHLREMIAQKKLDEMLSIQDSERTYFHKLPFTCIFCKEQYNNLPESFQHMTLIHRLAIGKLHNLVFVEEFLNILDFQLNHLNACIYCEHMFPSSTILKKHCRNSKHHFRIKPDNQKYDKYYISNYLLSPKEKKGVEDSDDYLGGCCSSVASAREEGQGDEDATWADWDEPLQEDEPVQCLFDDMICQNVDLLIQEHLKNVHQFDLYEYFERFQLEFYDRIKLVNYIRLESAKYKCFACGHQADDLETFLIHLAMDQGHLSHLPVEESWKNPQYLLPVNENDPLLRVLEICSDEDEN